MLGPLLKQKGIMSKSLGENSMTKWLCLFIFKVIVARSKSKGFLQSPK